MKNTTLTKTVSVDTFWSLLGPVDCSYGGGGREVWLGPTNTVNFCSLALLNLKLLIIIAFLRHVLNGLLKLNTVLQISESRGLAAS